MYDLFALRRLAISAAAAAILALALSACGGGGGGGSPAELAAAPASGNGGAAPADGDSAAAGAPPGAGAGGGSPPVEPGAQDPGAGVPVGEGPGAGGPTAPGGAAAASPSAAAWHVFGEVGTGPNGAALVTAEDLAGVSTYALNYANVFGPNAYYYGKGRPSGVLLGYPYQGAGLSSGGSPPQYPYQGAGLPSGSVSLSDDTARPGAGWMEVRVGHNDAGQVSYGLTYAESKYVTTRDRRVETYRWTVDSEAEGTNVRRLGFGGRQGAMFRRETDAGNLWAAVATDISGPGDTDWLATGVWAHKTTTGLRDDWLDSSWDWSNGSRFGVFASGGDPYGGSLDPDARAELITALTGSATYEGGASGVYSRRTGATEATRRNDLFSADATLTIDFSAETGSYPGAGAAAGRIHNMKIGGAPIAGNPEIALFNGLLSPYGEIWETGLRSVSVTIDDGGAWEGGDTGRWKGGWGALLFGNPASGATGADKLPGSVAGAFSVGDGKNYAPVTPGWEPRGHYIIGAFAAHRTAWTDAPEGVRQDAP